MQSSSARQRPPLLRGTTLPATQEDFEVEPDFLGYKPVARADTTVARHLNSSTEDSTSEIIEAVPRREMIRLPELGGQSRLPAVLLSQEDGDVQVETMWV